MKHNIKKINKKIVKKDELTQAFEFAQNVLMAPFKLIAVIAMILAQVAVLGFVFSASIIAASRALRFILFVATVIFIARSF